VTGGRWGLASHLGYHSKHDFAHFTYSFCGD
jgi:hypothetical protein